MPPKRKKLGRPPGSKNKKPSVKDLANKLAKIKRNNIEESVKTTTDYQCTVCDKYFPSKKALLKHKAIEVSKVIYTKAPFSCQECRKKFRFEKSYQKHLQHEHSKLPNSVACDKCHVRCPDEATLLEHTQKVHERNMFLCPHCKKEFVRHSHVLRHLAQSGCDGQSASCYSCEVCDAKFSRKDNLTVHIRLQHIFRKDYFCKYCKFSTKNFSKLVNHWHKHHAETPDQYQCDECSKWISSRAAMMKHLEIHGEKKYSCDMCGYSTYTVEVMRRHILTHVEDKPHKCNLCNRSYIQRVQLQRHLEKHMGNLCTECGQTFSSRAKMLVHLREHMGLEKLRCPLESCPYSTKDFINESSLTYHLNVHLDNKPHSCDVCEKKFHSEINLKRHLETHTLDRPRRCMYCVSARAYVRGEQLIRHVRKSHPAAFRSHLQHVRQVLGAGNTTDRVKKSEIESILNLLDAEADRILQGYSGSGVLYGGMQEDVIVPVEHSTEKKTNNPLMSEEDLADNLSKLITQLIDQETLSLFGWPGETVDVVLEKVIEQCGARAADREKWTRVQRLRENTKHLFLYVIEDKNIARMLDTHTIDQIVIHILKQVSEDDSIESNQ
ncbi:unnamed protein product [Arctia plantaginis]|uniref:C2H2-type domain-containing protein n=1 Tax=Arctia plantaginis TaxID=874455 RepID=A0A8S1AW30_ARCPL|nr:unnamed protein product [Arctia plantaginis]